MLFVCGSCEQRKHQLSPFFTSKSLTMNSLISKLTFCLFFLLLTLFFSRSKIFLNFRLTFQESKEACVAFATFFQDGPPSLETFVFFLFSFFLLAKVFLARIPFATSEENIQVSLQYSTFFLIFCVCMCVCVHYHFCIDYKKNTLMARLLTWRLQGPT